MSTHAIARIGAGSTTALALTQIGDNIELPAGGPWKIFGLWAQVVKSTTLPAEGCGGALVINALSGDLTPDPAPGRYPLPGNPGTSSANSGSAAVPLNIWSVLWNAAGKSVISLSYLQDLVITTASKVACGIIFGDSVPTKLPLVFCDRVQSSFSSGSEQTIGTITLSEKASKIVGIFADLNKGDALTTAEEILATIRLSSDDVKMPPAQYPCQRAFDAGDGTVEGESAMPRMDFIPVDIPIVGGSRVTVSATTSIAVTGNADISVYLAYE